MPSPIAQKGHPKMGGIKKGQKTRVTLLRECIEQNDLSPLDFLVRVAGGDASLLAGIGVKKITIKDALDAAKAAAPYLHRKQPTTVELRDITELSNEELRRIADRSKAAAAANSDDDSEDD